MKFGVCKLNSVALRFEPDDKSEMVSQLLFGETFKILFSEGVWHNISIDYDHYEGWVLTNQIMELKQDSYEELVLKNQTISNELITFITTDNNELQTISLGANLPNYHDKKFTILKSIYQFDGNSNSKILGKEHIIQTAYMYLNTPFLWGGKTPIGVDCSGFTQMVYKINGHSLLRDAHQQASQGEVLSFIEECDPGDLAFFDNEEGEIIHVGIILANNYIIHCHDKVRIDRLDQSGIYNIDTKRHTHNLRVIKQIF